MTKTSSTTDIQKMILNRLCNNKGKTYGVSGDSGFFMEYKDDHGDTKHSKIEWRTAKSLEAKNLIKIDWGKNTFEATENGCKIAAKLPQPFHIARSVPGQSWIE